jgi:phage baseplate assembly protein gpV
MLATRKTLGGWIMALTHNRRAATRTSVTLGALTAGGLLLAAQAASAQECTRAILQRAAEDYIATQETADPTNMHMGLWVDYNEQLQNATLSTGVLSKPMKVDFYRTAADTTACTVYIEAAITDPAHPYVTGAILTARGGQVSNMQVVYTDKVNGWLFNPANTAKYSKAENWKEIPEAQRDSRETLLAAANAYLDLFNDKNVKVSVAASAVKLKDSEIQLECPLLAIDCKAVVWLDPPNETLNCSV